MSEVKTTKEWLSELPEPARSQALENAQAVTINTLHASLWSALLGAFSWVYSPQGHSYWSAIAWDSECAQAADELPQFPPSPWQPIDSAPTDGTEILVWHNRAHRDNQDDGPSDFEIHSDAVGSVDEDGIYIASYCDSYQDSDGWECPSYTVPGGWFTARNGEHDLAVNPTHWMPLPSPPQS